MLEEISRMLEIYLRSMLATGYWLLCHIPDF
jgi:hypothetical protein